MYICTLLCIHASKQASMYEGKNVIRQLHSLKFLFDNGRESGIRFKKQSVKSGIFLIFDIFFIRLKVGMSWFRFECHKRSVFSFCKVFQKNTTRRTTDKGWRFFENPSGLTLQEALRTQKYLCTRTTNRHYVP